MAGDDTIQTVDEERFDALVREATVPVVVDFWAGWCGPCKRMDERLRAVRRELEGRVRFVRIDIDSSGDLPHRFGITNVPTLIVLESGKVVDQMVGAGPVDEIRELLTRHL